MGLAAQDLNFEAAIGFELMYKDLAVSLSHWFYRAFAA